MLPRLSNSDDTVLSTALSTSITYYPLTSKVFKRSVPILSITVNHKEFPESVRTIQHSSTDPSIDNALCVLRKLGKQIDFPVGVISVEDCNVPIVQLYIKGDRQFTRGVVVDMTRVLRDVKETEDLGKMKMNSAITFFSSMVILLCVVVSVPMCMQKCIAPNVTGVLGRSNVVSSLATLVPSNISSVVYSAREFLCLSLLPIFPEKLVETITHFF